MSNTRARIHRPSPELSQLTGACHSHVHHVLSTDSMPGIAHKHQLSTERGSYGIYPHFSNEETEAQRKLT